MAKSASIQEYIRQRLAALDKKEDLKEISIQGKLSFGIDSASYCHLPAWKDLLIKKKKLVRWIWIDALCLALFVVLMTTENWKVFSEDWVKAILGILGLSIVVMVFFIITAYYSLFFRFRQVEREVRKLIYQDLLKRLEEEGIKER